MEVWEKINYLLEEKNMSKQDFANRLIELEPRLKRTSETPSTQTILGYLYGKRELKVELITTQPTAAPVEKSVTPVESSGRPTWMDKDKIFGDKNPFATK